MGEQEEIGCWSLIHPSGFREANGNICKPEEEEKNTSVIPKNVRVKD